MDGDEGDVVFNELKTLEQKLLKLQLEAEKTLMQLKTYAVSMHWH